ncbi:MAG: serine/threonine-protein kinase [Pirellulales bacterium]
MMQRRPTSEPHAPLLYGDYLLEQLLGSGGMGKVFRARERATGRAVAVKALHKARQHDPRAVDLFVQESQILARLDHPAIVRVHGLGRFPGGGYFLAMDFVEGTDLQTRLESGALAPGEAIRIAIVIGEAVGHAHERGVVHCDLKPANVLVDRAGGVFVSDFGFAHLTAQAATVKRLLGGTPGYIAPELLRGEAPTPAADVYSLGALLAALPGIPCPGEPPSLAELPDAVAAICRRCLANDPRERYASMGALVDELRQRLPSR